MPTDPVRVLLVVDQPADARRVSEALASDGSIAVTRAERISSALALLRGQTFDVAVIDLGVPDSHGVDGVERALRTFPGLPIVVLADAAELDRARSLLEAGAEGVLEKSAVETAALLRLLREAIVIHRVAVRLSHPGVPTDADLAPIRDLAEGIAVVARGRVVALNEVGARLLAEARASDPEEVAGLFAHTLSGPKRAGAPGAATRAEGTTSGLGELALLREDGSRATSRYVRRVLTLPHGVHALIRIQPPLPETEIPAPPPPPPPPPPSSEPTEEELASARPRAARSHRSSSGRRGRNLPSPAIDPKAWAELEEQFARDGGDLPAHVARFLKDGSRLLHAITSSLDAGTVTESISPAREFRAISAEVGALRLAQACAKLEQVAGSPQPTRLPELAKSVGREFERVGSELRTRLPATPSP